MSIGFQICDRKPLSRSHRLSVRPFCLYPFGNFSARLRQIVNCYVTMIQFQVLWTLPRGHRSPGTYLVGSWALHRRLNAPTKTWTTVVEITLPTELPIQARTIKLPAKIDNKQIILSFRPFFLSEKWKLWTKGLCCWQHFFFFCHARGFKPCPVVTRFCVFYSIFFLSSPQREAVMNPVRIPFIVQFRWPYVPSSSHFLSVFVLSFKWFLWQFFLARSPTSFAMSACLLALTTRRALNVFPWYFNLDCINKPTRCSFCMYLFYKLCTNHSSMVCTQLQIQ